jgi:hypothetical protein
LQIHGQFCEEVLNVKCEKHPTQRSMTRLKRVLELPYNIIVRCLNRLLWYELDVELIHNTALTISSDYSFSIVTESGVSSIHGSSTSYVT